MAVAIVAAVITVIAGLIPVEDAVGQRIYLWPAIAFWALATVVKSVEVGLLLCELEMPPHQIAQDKTPPAG